MNLERVIPGKSEAAAPAESPPSAPAGWGRLKQDARRAALVAGLCLMFGWMSMSAARAEGVDPEADKVLRAMSAYLGGLPAFSVDVDIDNEHVDLDGQKLQLSSYASLKVARPGKLHMARRGVFTDTELILNEKFLTLYGKGFNAYVQKDSPGSIDDAIETIRNDIGLDAPGADLLYADPYSGLIDGVLKGTYFGTVHVNGIDCHYLSFREARVDWQLWVQVGDTPFPVKYVITTKWVTGAPQYAIRFHNWNAAPGPESGSFEFKAPRGAKKIESVQVNAIGEPMIMEEGQ
jgi:hypothetical protein